VPRLVVQHLLVQTLERPALEVERAHVEAEPVHVQQSGRPVAGNHLDVQVHAVLVGDRQLLVVLEVAERFLDVRVVVAGTPLLGVPVRRHTGGDTARPPRRPRPAHRSSRRCD
jgi:hypothetical protein